MNRILLAIFATIIFTGCNKEPIFESERGDFIPVSLSVSGEVSVQESPIFTRSENTGSRDLYGVQVLQDGQYYAYGLFDNISDMHLYLHTGQRYKVLCCMVRNAKDVINHYRITSSSGYDPQYTVVLRVNERSYSLYRNNGWSGYSYPFALNGKGNSGNSRFGRLNDVDINSFIYSNTTGMPFLSERATDVSSENNWNANQICYPSVLRYYGESDEYLINASAQIISFPLKHVGFGIKYTVTGVTDGSAAITIKNNDKIFFTKNDINSSFSSEEKVFQFSDVESAYAYADNYTENITVSMTWLRGVGVNQDLGSQVVQVKRNAMNYIKVALSTSTRATKGGDAPETAFKVSVDSVPLMNY